MTRQEIIDALDKYLTRGYQDMDRDLTEFASLTDEELSAKLATVTREG